MLDKTEAATRSPVRKKRTSLMPWLVIVAVAGGAYYYASTHGKAEQSGKPEASGTPANANEFRPTEAQWADLKITPVTGMVFRTVNESEGKIALDEYKSTPVYSPYSGRVTRLLAQPGDAVKAGDPLFALDATEFVQAHNDLVNAIDVLNKANAQLALTKINEARQHELYLAKGAALRDWEQAQADLTAAKNDETSAGIGLAAVRNRLRILGKSEEEIKHLEATGGINPEVTVNAPIAGTVTSRKIGPGQYIQAGASDPVFTIGDLSTVWLVANVHETDIPNVRVGEQAEVRVLAYPGQVFHAKITYVAPSLDPVTRRLPVRAEVENKDGKLKPEMFANFSIISSEPARSLAVPQDAVVYEGDEARVWVAGKDHRISSRTIRVGRTNGAMVEVLSGLSVGESIVSGGALFIDRAVRGASAGFDLPASRAASGSEARLERLA